MAFDGTEGQQITIAEASTMTLNFRTTNPNGVKGHFLGKELLDNILAQPECVGLRIYYALNAKGGKELVVVGVDNQENDIISGIIADRTIHCPPNCGTSNPLNS